MYKIASWPEPKNRTEIREGQRWNSSSRPSIATELQPVEDPAWGNCIDALLELLSHPDEIAGGVSPTRISVDAALHWLCYLRSHHPTAPPTYITREPQGGIIIERRSHRSSDGAELIVEITIYNNETAELTIYLNGRVEEMQQVEFAPSVPSKNART
jgi:hypothetical protein